jgi:hypothetical protein
MARANAVLEVKQTGNMVEFAVLGAGSVTLDMGKISPEVLAYAAYHGLKQRLSDCIVSEETAGDKLAAITTLRDHYETGTADWRVKVASGERDMGGVTIAAVARVQGASVADITAKVATMAEKKGTTTKAILASLAKSPDVIKMVATIKAEKSTAGDGDDLLLELMA